MSALVGYDSGTPTETGVYACRVDDDAPGLLKDQFLLWLDGRWCYLSSDQFFRGTVHAWIGPLARKLQPRTSFRNAPWFRLLVCGGRKFLDRARVDYVLGSAWQHYGDALVVCHGGAPGADSLAGLWASHNGVPCISMVAPWHKFPKAAGPLRNGWLLTHLRPDAVLAFPGGSGTAHMKRIAQAAGLTVYEG